MPLCFKQHARVCQLHFHFPSRVVPPRPVFVWSGRAAADQVGKGKRIDCREEVNTEQLPPGRAIHSFFSCQESYEVAVLDVAVCVCSKGELDDMLNWRAEFIKKMKHHKPWDEWNLTEELEIGQLRVPGWQQYVQKHLFARFKCSNCSRSWKSAQVTVLFHMQLLQNILGQALGKVKMRVFRQKCRDCGSDKYEEPTFTDETVQCILYNLVQKILERCYEKGNTFNPLWNPFPEEPVDGPHDRDNCEACEHGVCFGKSTPSSLGQFVQGEGSFVRPTSSVQPIEWERSRWRCCKILFYFLVVMAVTIFILFASIHGK